MQTYIQVIVIYPHDLLSQSVFLVDNDGNIPKHLATNGLQPILDLYLPLNASFTLFNFIENENTILQFYSVLPSRIELEGHKYVGFNEIKESDRELLGGFRHI